MAYRPNHLSRVLRGQRDALLGFLIDELIPWLDAAARWFHIPGMPRPSAPLAVDMVNQLRHLMIALELAWHRRPEYQPRPVRKPWQAPRKPTVTWPCDWPPCPNTVTTAQRHVTCGPVCAAKRRQWLNQHRLRVFGPGPSRRHRHLRLRDLVEKLDDLTLLGFVED